MSEGSSQQVLFSEFDLLKATSMVEARFDDPVEEATRVEITRRFLGAAMSAERALRVHTRCALVNHCGTHGTSNLRDAATLLFEALVAYTGLVREIALRGNERSAETPARTEPRMKLEVA